MSSAARSATVAAGSVASAASARRAPPLGVEGGDRPRRSSPRAERAGLGGGVADDPRRLGVAEEVVELGSV
jgi:hypothetical protein